MTHKKTRDLILKISILFSVMGAGYHVSSEMDPVSSIAYARSVYKTTQSIKLRSGRSFSKSVVTRIPADRTVDVIEVYDGGAWAKIRWNGSTGYMHTMYLKLTRVSDTPSETGSASGRTGISYQADGYHMYAAEDLTLRKSASGSSASLGRVQGGDDLLLINRSGSWFKVRHKGRYGWLPTRYVKDYAADGTASHAGSSSTAPSKGSSSQSKSTGTGTAGGQSYQADGYHMYAGKQTALKTGPGSSYSTRTTISKGTDLLLIDQSGSWFKVFHKSRYSWVKKADLKDYSNSSSGSSKGSGSGSPSSGSSSKGSGSGNSSSGSTSKGSGSGNSSSGSSGGSSKSSGVHSMTTRKQVRLLSGPNYDMSTLARLAKGTKVTVLDDWGYFVKVSCQGKTGYIHMNDLKKDKGYTSPRKTGGGSTAGSSSGVSSSNKKPSSATRSDLIRIDTSQSYGNRNIPVKGTIRNTSVSKVEIYLNGTYLDQAKLSASGFSYTIPSQVTRPGKNDLRVEAATGKGRLYQTRSLQVSKIPTIVIDAGHGGRDPGAIGRHKGKDHYEKDYNIKFAGNLKTELEKLGFRVIMTRTTDQWVDNSDRVTIANKYDADLLFAMHHNAVRNSTSSGGLSIFPSMKYSPSTQASFTESRDLAEMLATAYSSSGMNYRGAYRDIDISGHTLYIMRNAPMRTILTEMGFISSSSDIRKITDPSFQAKLPRAMARQIYRFFYDRN